MKICEQAPDLVRPSQRKFTLTGKGIPRDASHDLPDVSE